MAGLRVLCSIMISVQESMLAIYFCRDDETVVVDSDESDREIFEYLN